MHEEAPGFPAGPHLPPLRHLALQRDTVTLARHTMEHAPHPKGPRVNAYVVGVGVCRSQGETEGGICRQRRSRMMNINLPL